MQALGRPQASILEWDNRSPQARHFSSASRTWDSTRMDGRRTTG
ncbi:hypothetical protein [Azospirillum palustre]